MQRNRKATSPPPEDFHCFWLLRGTDTRDTFEKNDKYMQLHWRPYHITNYSGTSAFLPLKLTEHFCYIANGPRLSAFTLLPMGKCVSQYNFCLKNSHSKRIKSQLHRGTTVLLFVYKECNDYVEAAVCLSGSCLFRSIRYYSGNSGHSLTSILHKGHNDRQLQHESNNREHKLWIKYKKARKKKQNIATMQAKMYIL